MNLRQLTRGLGYLLSEMGDLALRALSPRSYDRVLDEVEARARCKLTQLPVRGTIEDAMRAEDVNLLEVDPAEFVRRTGRGDDNDQRDGTESPSGAYVSHPAGDQFTESQWLGHDPLQDPAERWDVRLMDKSELRCPNCRGELVGLSSSMQCSRCQARLKITSTLLSAL